MVAYNHKNLDDTYIRNASDEAFKKNLISNDEYKTVCTQYSGTFYSPNFFIRIGLFLLTIIISLMCSGLLFLLFGAIVEQHAEVLGILFSIIAYAVLELMTRSQRHFKSGVDDALIWVSAAAFLASIILAYDPLSSLTVSVIVFIISAYLSLRFANAIMAAIGFLSLLAIAFYLVLHLGTIGKIAAPILLMMVSLIVYLLVKGFDNRYLLRYYRLCLTAIEILSLIAVYLSVNYLVVRELSNEMFHLQLKEGESIPAGWLFWIITILLPVIYLIISFRRRDSLMFRISLLLMTATIFTIRYYYHILSPELAMMFGGVLVILIAYFTSKYFARQKYGITSSAPQEARNPKFLNVEALIVAEAFHQAPGNTGKTFEFGGGSGGGGGATGEY